jgi:hypothetical protein
MTPVRAVVAALLLGPGLCVSASAQPVCPQPSSAELRAALVSVYYFSHAAPQTLPQAWTPVDLARAARALRCDQSLAHASRRRRAAAKLVGGVTATQGTSPAASVARWRLAAALQDLGVPVADLFTQLQSMPHDTRERAEVATQRFFDREMLASFANGCCSCLVECVAGSDGELATVYFKSWVHRDLAHMKPILDPQAWDDEECGKGFFAETSHAGNTCGAASETDPPTNDPTAGTSWKGVLLEDFRYDYKSGGGSGSAGLRNFLDIDIQVTDPSYLLEYGLCESLGGSMTNPDGTVSPLGLEEDCGYSSAATVGIPNQSRVTGVKRLQFDIPGLTDLTVISLMVMADMITYDVLCCDSGGEPPAENCVCPKKLCGQGTPNISADAEPLLCKIKNE